MKIELKNAIGRLIPLCSLPNIKVARINPCTPLQKGLRTNPLPLELQKEIMSSPLPPHSLITT